MGEDELLLHVDENLLEILDERHETVLAGAGWDVAEVQLDHDDVVAVGLGECVDLVDDGVDEPVGGLDDDVVERLAVPAVVRGDANRDDAIRALDPEGLDPDGADPAVRNIARIHDGSLPLRCADGKYSILLIVLFDNSMIILY